MSFPGVLHGFTNPAATQNASSFDLPLGYDADADQRSWQALLRFLAL
jgi:dienelactone hydrolase